MQSSAEEKIINVQSLEPSFRHQTIFILFEKLPEGDSFVLHNNHDPQPLKYQLINLYGESFDWEYLQSGPEWWDVRVTKHGGEAKETPAPAKEEVPQQESASALKEDEVVLNIPSIEPRLKHETIFKTFEKLQVGESFVIHNDHDPQPVYYQLKELHGEVFEWQYLQKGPQWWDIRVTRTVDEPSDDEEEILVVNVPAITDHHQKHQIILNTFDDLQPGEAFIIHNDHDPMPVRYQMLNIFGDIFTWEYLEKGPEWWDILVTKKHEDPDEEEKVIDVPSIAPRFKHETIFKTYNQLKEGRSFIIHNDHDPQPMFFQLQALHGADAFTWEYLQKGPLWFDIRVTKVKEDVKEEPEEDKVIDVPSIEPRLKHQTIFKAFDDLKQGESFIIHNDHDPLPLQYQLEQMHGEGSFTWDYLQRGPVWFDIRVTKEKTTGAAQEEESVSGPAVDGIREGEIVIDVPSIEPHSKKHDAILSTYDNLEKGQSLIIHNDHDPKPLFYQMRAMHGDVFDWEYVQAGPEIWDVRVTKRGAETQETVGEIVAQDYSKSEIFKKYGIDFCCEGNQTVREACAALGIDPEKVENELKAPETSVTSGMNFNDWDPAFLADFIKNTHHKYFKKYLPEIGGYAVKVERVHGDKHPELLTVQRIFDEVSEGISQQVELDEKQLFPKIKDIVKAKEEGASFRASGFVATLKEAEEHHRAIGQAMKHIRNMTDDYHLPEDACASYTLMFKMMQELEDHLFQYVHLENNILFPKTITLEKSMS